MAPRPTTNRDTSVSVTATGVGIMTSMVAFIALIVAGVTAAGLFPAVGPPPTWPPTAASGVHPCMGQPARPERSRSDLRRRHSARTAQRS